MARAYSNDLRRKFLQAYDEGEDTLQEWIREQVEAQPDVTLRELRERLAESQQLYLSTGRM